MREEILPLLACPVCGSAIEFDGTRSNGRFVNGCLSCRNGHLYQVKKEIALLKDAKLSAEGFEWKVDVADEQRYDTVRKQYDSYLTPEQKAATGNLTAKLANIVAKAGGKTDNMILDVATGMGSFLLPLAEKTSNHTLLIGTDVDEKPLRGLQSKARRARTYGKISPIVTDAKHLAFSANVFLNICSYFGFDNVPETLLAFKECARTLQPNGKIMFSSLWLKEKSQSMGLAERHKVNQISSKPRLERTLKKAGLTLDRFEEVYHGVWPHNPMDLLPVEGEEYSHVIAVATKTER